MSDGPRFILLRYARDKSPRYVAQRPGDGGKDWGYVTDHKQAAYFSPYWKRRFLSDMRAVGAACAAVEIA
jgi:hypothetical protein